MPKPGLTLKEVQRTSLKLDQNKPRVVRAEDVLTKDEIEKLKINRIKGISRPKRKYDNVDALMAEIIARFGYDTYKSLNNGEIEFEKIMRFIYAERARESSSRLSLYGIIMSMVGACIRRSKGQPQPRGPKIAQKIFKNEQKIAEGEAK